MAVVRYSRDTIGFSRVEFQFQPTCSEMAKTFTSQKKECSLKLKLHAAKAGGILLFTQSRQCGGIDLLDTIAKHLQITHCFAAFAGSVLMKFTTFQRSSSDMRFSPAGMIPLIPLEIFQ